MLGSVVTLAGRKVIGFRVSPNPIMNPSDGLRVLGPVVTLAGIATAVHHLVLVVAGLAVAVPPVVPAVEDEGPGPLQNVAELGVVRRLEVHVVVHFVDPVLLWSRHKLLCADI